MNPTLFAIALLFQPPPPIVRTTAPPAPPAPPAPALYPRPADREALRPETIELRVMSEEGLIWQGTLRVGPVGAVISQDRREATAEQCAADVPYSGAGLHTNFSINVSRLYRVTPGGRVLYSVSVRWSRPASRDGCMALGSRTVQLEQRVELEPGREAVLRGDAGLTVTLRRR